jgi:dTDP-4-dehydrorhamnose reductase
VRVLILGSDTPLGQALVAYLANLGRHQAALISRAACRWKSERQAKKTVARGGCDIVVDIRLEAGVDGGERLQEADVQRCRWVGKACQRAAMPYLLVSSSRVFSGQADRSYTELDPPDSSETVGQLLAAAEMAVAQSCQQHLILRLGTVFSNIAPNLITSMLGRILEGTTLVLDHRIRDCPVAVTDGARVISGVLDQVSAGARPWGIFHYGSSDSATNYEFAEALLASASQFAEFSLTAVEPGGQPEDEIGLRRELDCSKICNTFAIRQLAWRGEIADLVKQYFQHQQ